MIAFWQFFAGLGVFLLGMHLLEDALKQLAGRTFKIFLKNHTQNKLKAIGSGTIVTAFLQSSSVVSLIVLAFVGAGIMSMRNALAVVFGANLGTTLDSWVVAILGFKFNLELFSFPAIAIAGIGIALFEERKTVYQGCRFLAGFGFLFLGLDFMKGSIEHLVTNFDFAPYLDQNRVVFSLIGFIITAIIQSSSATMVIILSALNTGVLPFPAAFAIVIGSELGTSLKLLLGSIGGIPEKKRVAMGNIIFNVAITVFALIFFTPLITLVKDIIGVNNPLIALVLLQTIINFSGLVIFYPMLNGFGDFLERQFTRISTTATVYISKIPKGVPGVMVDALEKETKLFIYRVILLNLKAFHIKRSIIDDPSSFDSLVPANDKFNSRSFSENYEFIKKAEGEILEFYTGLNRENMVEPEHKRMDQLETSVRNAMYAAKGMKDIRHNRKELINSAEESKYQQYLFFETQLEEFYKRIIAILKINERSVAFNELATLQNDLHKRDQSRISFIYEEAKKGQLSEIDISTLMNVNRELYSSCKAILLSVKDLLLDPTESESFDNIPS